MQPGPGDQDGQARGLRNQRRLLEEPARLGPGAPLQQHGEAEDDDVVEHHGGNDLVHRKPVLKHPDKAPQEGSPASPPSTTAKSCRTMGAPESWLWQR